MEGLLKEKDLRDIVCDLHIHTSCSDGVKEASFVLEKARQQGVSIISITDHNNIDAYSKLKDIDCKDILLITGTFTKKFDRLRRKK